MRELHTRGASCFKKASLFMFRSSLASDKNPTDIDSDGEEYECLVSTGRIGLSAEDEDVLVDLAPLDLSPALVKSSGF